MKRFLSALLILVVTGLSAQTKIYTPALSSPNNAAANQMPNIVLSWAGVTGTGIIKYKLVVDEDAAFTSPMAFYTEFITSAQMANLHYTTTYYWRVKAYDMGTGDSSYWSETRSFTTFSKLDPKKPENKAKEQQPMVTIEWKDRIGANLISGNSQFNYILDTTPNFNSPALTSAFIDGSTFKTTSPKLRFGTNYFWKVRALNLNDTTIWSDVFKFRTLDTIKLVTPDNNKIDMSINEKVGWSKVVGATKYDYEISLTDDFADPLRYATELITVVPEGISFGKKYYWRARARHESDTSTWGNVRNFTIVAYPKAKTPENGAIDIETQPEFVWTKMNGITNIEIQYANNEAFVDAFSQKIADTVRFKCPYILENKTMYYWRLRAFTTTDSTVWSPTWSFKTGSGIGIPQASKSGMQIYPNPAKDKVSIRFTSGQSGNVHLRLVDLLGQNIIIRDAEIIEGVPMVLDIAQVPNGIYLVKIESAGKTTVQKLVVDR
jgi:hypothetical protein